LGDKIVGTQAQRLHPSLWHGQAGQDQHRRVVTGDPHAPHHLETLDVGQREIKQNDVVFIMPQQLKSVLPAVGLIDDRAGRFQHERYTACSKQALFNQKDAHPPLLNKT
jgi:hypothetical protein